MYPSLKTNFCSYKIILCYCNISNWFLIRSNLSIDFPVMRIRGENLLSTLTLQSVFRFIHNVVKRDILYCEHTFDCRRWFSFFISKEWGSIFLSLLSFYSLWRPKKTFVVNLKSDEACFSPLFKANLLRLVTCSFISTNTVGVVFSSRRPWTRSVTQCLSYS